MDIPRLLDSELDKWYEVICKWENLEDLLQSLKKYTCNTLWHICSDNELHHASSALRSSLVQFFGLLVKGPGPDQFSILKIISKTGLKLVRLVNVGWTAVHRPVLTSS